MQFISIIERPYNEGINEGINEVETLILIFLEKEAGSTSTNSIFWKQSVLSS